MKKIALSLILAASAFSGLALAGTTCPVRICRPPVNGGGSSVPEPATLALLGVGVAAVGVAAARRRKKKDDSEK